MQHHLELASSLAPKIVSGEITSEDLVRDCLARIEATDGAIQAWSHLDADHALAQAKRLDGMRQSGRPLGPLHGVPVGVKDIYDTCDMPTEYGSPIHAGRRPDKDAAVVAKLREAGAVIMGKTVTTEFAFMAAGKTTNPHNTAHTPGGSSSGSAAAVAAGHVPLAVGTQTAGSVIRPAAFCGVYGIKPSRGMISRAGVLRTSKTLDQIGAFGRSLEDVTLLIDAITGYDGADDATYARAKPNFHDGYLADAPVEPNFLWFDLPFDNRLADDARTGFSELRDVLGDQIESLPLPDSHANLIDHQRVIHHYEMRRHLDDEYQNHADKLSAGMRNVLDMANDISDEDYANSRAAAGQAQVFFEELFHDFDAILTPSAPGEAPVGLDTTGDPVFCAMWNFCGLPSLTLPLLTGAHNLPIGVQLVAGLEEDHRLCRTARWLMMALEEE